MKPLISIALCTYNGDRFLQEQLESLLIQDYEHIEIVAVDDRSTDNTRNILHAFAQKDNRLKVYRNEQNLGHTLNFERAIGLCQGDYIALCDQDDVWDKGKIRILEEHVDGHVMVYHDSDFIDESGKQIGDNTLASKHRMYDGESCMPVILANSIHGHTILFDSKLKKYLQHFNKDFSHDWAIVYAAFNIGSVKYVDRVLAHYRQHQNSVTDFLEQRNVKISPKRSGNLARLPVNAAWLTYCLQFECKKEPGLVTEACALFLNLTMGKKRLRCFFFMLQYFDQLFYALGYKQRGFFSKVNFVRKLCFK